MACIWVKTGDRDLHPLLQPDADTLNVFMVAKASSLILAPGTLSHPSAQALCRCCTSVTASFTPLTTRWAPLRRRPHHMAFGLCDHHPAPRTADSSTLHRIAEARSRLRGLPGEGRNLLDQCNAWALQPAVPAAARLGARLVSPCAARLAPDLRRIARTSMPAHTASFNFSELMMCPPDRGVGPRRTHSL